MKPNVKIYLNQTNLFYMHILGSSVIQADELSFYKFYTFLTSFDMEQLYNISCVINTVQCQTIMSTMKIQRYNKCPGC